MFEDIAQNTYQTDRDDGTSTHFCCSCCSTEHRVVVGSQKKDNLTLYTMILFVIHRKRVSLVSIHLYIPTYSFSSFSHQSVGSQLFNLFFYGSFQQYQCIPYERKDEVDGLHSQSTHRRAVQQNYFSMLRCSCACFLFFSSSSSSAFG